MIQLKNIHLSFGNQTVFNNISHIFNKQERIGLVGRNGSGKSTLLKAIAGMQLLDDGSIATNRGATIAYLPQEVVLHSDKTIFDEVLSTFEEAFHFYKQNKDFIHLIDSGATLTPKQLEEYAESIDRLQELSTDSTIAEIKKILMGLGFKQQQLEMPVSSLSVGWQMRLVLAKLLLQKADFYLFDEPTNHLDIFAKDWFIDFLRTAPFGFIIVCHEHYFLDKACTQILELELGNATFYGGNYSHYKIEKKHRSELLHAAYIQQQKELKQKIATIERFRAGTRATQAQSMIKAVDKIERITIPPSPPTIAIQFPPLQQSGKIVLKVEHVAHQFDEKKLFSNVSLEIERGQKVALVAANGVGKTTLFNIIAGKYQLQNGTITLGHNVNYTLFDQDPSKVFDLEKTILQNLNERCAAIPEAKIRSLLGAFLFNKDDVHKKVKVLSGGEKNRVAMVAVLLQNANFLLLDEPTNHLDIESKEILLHALQEYKGTILFVSHDQGFINQLATHTIELTSTGTHVFAGNYEAYIYYKKQIELDAQAVIEKTNAAANISAEKQKKGVVRTAQESQEIRKEIKKLERSIDQLEHEIMIIQQSFAQLTYGTTTFIAAHEALKKSEQHYKAAMERWEQLQEMVNE